MSGLSAHLQALNGLDWLLIAVVLLGALHGWLRGFVATAANLMALAASLLLAAWGTPRAAPLLDRAGVPDPWGPPLAFLLILVTARLLLAGATRPVVAAVPRSGAARSLDRALGPLPGALGGLVNALILALLLLAWPMADRIARSAQDSTIAAALRAPAEWVEAQLGPIFNPALARLLPPILVQPESTETVALPFTVTDPKVRPDLEAAMLVLLNEERAKEGLRPLRADAQATEVARSHSRDMFAKGYFSHIAPDGKSPFDRMRQRDVRFLAAGENLALARTLPMAHQGLMNSPGHRANILRPAFGRVGVGIVDGGRHGLMVTQTFRD